MNLILLNRDDGWSSDSVVLLKGRRAVHMIDVLGVKPGDRLRVGLLDGLTGIAVVREIVDRQVQLMVQLTDSPPRRHHLDIVLALPRPKMLRRIFRIVAEFGVSHLHLINSARVEKSFWQSPVLQPDAVQKALQEGMERSRDTVTPIIHQHRRFRPFVEDDLVGLCAGRPCWIAHPSCAVPVTAPAAHQPGVVMIGPEGGFVPFEVNLAEQALARRFHLGERILSVDTALTSVLAQSESVFSML